LVLACQRLNSITARGTVLKVLEPPADTPNMLAPPRAILIVVAACLTAMMAGILIGHYAIPAPAKSRAAGNDGYFAPPEEPSPSEATTNVRAAIPALEAWNADHGSYRGATLQTLRRKYDYGLHDVTVVFTTRDDYCIESRVGDSVASKHGPGGEVLPQACG
jgi:hypothetical protein